MKKTRFVFIILLYCLWGLTSNLIHPITTDYVHSLSLPTFYFGIFFSLMSLGQVVGAVVFGKLSDKIGRKMLLCIGMAGYGIFQLGFGFVNQWPLLILVFRVLGGFFASAPNTLFITFAIDHLGSDSRVKGLSYLASFKYLGDALGYFIGGNLYSSLSWNFGDVFLLQAGCCFGFAIISYFLLGAEHKEAMADKFSSLRSIRSVGLSNLVFLAGVLFIAMGQININKYFDIFFIDIGYSAGQLGYFCLLTGVVGCLGSLFLVPLFKKEDTKRLKFALPLVLFLQVLTIVLTFNLNKDWFVILICSSHLVYCICRVLTNSLEQAYVAAHTDRKNYGLMMGIMQSVLSLGNVLAPLLGSAVYKDGEILIFNIAAALIGGGLVILLPLFFLPKKKVSEEK